MVETLTTMLMGVLILAAGYYGALRWIVLDGGPVCLGPIVPDEVGP